MIPHASGTQRDWLELPDPPAAWGWGKLAHLLVGSLAHAGKWRGYLAPSENQPHLVAGMDRITRGLGGCMRVWRFDRMATVGDPGSGRVTASFAGVAKRHSVAMAICPARRGNRKGVVEKVNHTASQRWWRTLADEATPEQAQASVDWFARVRGDTRLRATVAGRSSVAVVATTEPLSAVPAQAYPVIVAEDRTASCQTMASYRGNRYSVPRDLAVVNVVVSHPVGRQFCDIAATSGIVIARHRMAADGLGGMMRDSGHVIALDAAAMATAATGLPHRRKERIPPGPAAKAAAAQLIRLNSAATAAVETPTPPTGSTVIDLSRLREGRPEQGHPMTFTARTPKTAGPRRQVAVSSRAPIWPNSNWSRPPKRFRRCWIRPASRGVADRRAGTAAGRRGPGQHGPPILPAGCGPPACSPRPPWPTSTSMPPPGSTASSSTSWAPAAT